MARAKIKCTDGVSRTQTEYTKWIKSLVQLAKIEPGDLTDEEVRALEEEGYDVEDMEEC